MTICYVAPLTVFIFFIITLSPEGGRTCSVAPKVDPTTRENALSESRSDKLKMLNAGRNSFGVVIFEAIYIKSMYISM